MDYYNLENVKDFQYFSSIYQFFLNFKFPIIYQRSQQKLYWSIPISNNSNNKQHSYQLLTFIISLFSVQLYYPCQAEYHGFNSTNLLNCYLFFQIAPFPFFSFLLSVPLSRDAILISIFLKEQFTKFICFMFYL